MITSTLDLMIGPSFNPEQARALLEWMSSEMTSGSTLKFAQAEEGIYFGAPEDGVVFFLAKDGTISTEEDL